MVDSPLTDEWLRVTLSSIGDAVIATDNAGAVTFLNPVAQSLVGWTQEEASGKPLDTIFNIINEDSRRAVESPVTKVLREGVVVGLANHTLLIAKDGTERPIDDSAAPIRNAAGEVAGVVLVFRDVTERRQVERRIQQSEKRKAALIRAALDCIIKIDHEGRIVEFNPAAEQTFGYRHDDVLGQQMADLIIPPSLRGEHRRALANYLATGEGPILDQRIELTALRADGTEFPVELSVTRSPVDGPPMFAAFLRDITDRKRSEQTMKEQMQALEDLHRQKDEFLAMLSHELRNPLAPILNAVQLLALNQNEDEIQREARTIIDRQVSQLTRIVDDLLEVSRITSGRIRLHKERISATGIVASAVESVRSLIGQRSHSLEVSQPSRPIWLLGDAARLQQVIVNLLTNAAKYTDEGGRIAVSVRQEGDEAIIRVKDTGVGITPDLLPRIFDIFTQAERSLDRSQGGLGIGLTLVQRIVEMHGGRVEVHSVVGEGSEFTVRLPVAVEQAIPQIRTGEKPTARVGRSLRVLVVDDNVDAARSLAKLLEKSGHQTSMAHDGPSTLPAALDFRPDVILLDIGLPGLNGFEVAKKLRQEPELKSVRLVALTGYGQDADREHSREAGFDLHLVKPADFNKVQEILASLAAQ